MEHPKEVTTLAANTDLHQPQHLNPLSTAPLNLLTILQLLSNLSTLPHNSHTGLPSLPTTLQPNSNHTVPLSPLTTPQLQVPHPAITELHQETRDVRAANTVPQLQLQDNREVTTRVVMETKLNPITLQVNPTEVHKDRDKEASVTESTRRIPLLVGMERRSKLFV
jgi:hypothetical protein